MNSGQTTNQLSKIWVPKIGTQFFFLVIYNTEKQEILAK